MQILDPATGTGTFVTNLISHLADSGEPDALERLEHKYRHEIHANEVAILPYYIANLNIEYTYREMTGRYLEFPNLVFVDTLDNMEWQGATGGAVARQASFNLGGFSTENWMRVQEQNEKTISVIIGNPPYNAHQNSWNEFNPNRNYPQVDRRIRETYVSSSSAHKTKQYDMYKRFIRWASDRLADDGVIAFITNRAYIDALQDDGFRRVAAEEFTGIYLLDLGSDVRRNPKISGTTHNVFGIQTGVAIGFFVRDKFKLGRCSIHYARREDSELAMGKLAYLSGARLDEIAFEDITPDNKGNWLNQSNSDFERLLPLAKQKLKAAIPGTGSDTLFDLYSMGVVTNRDSWVYDFDFDNLGRKVRWFINSYEEMLAKFGGTDFVHSALGTSIKWTPDLITQLRYDVPNTFNRADIRRTLYRPFVRKVLYYNKNLNWSHYQLFQVFPKGSPKENVVVSFCMNNKDFYVLAADSVFDLHLTGDSWGLPLYRYTEDEERVSNITSRGLQKFQERYGDDSITAEHIFAYTYAVLHDPVYRDKYAVDLLREFPRLPLYHDFHVWERMGQELLDLHIGFESAEPWPLGRVDKPGDAKKVILRQDKEKGSIILDDKTTLTGVPPQAWRYRLGSRSALEWVLDQYKEKKPRDPTIAEKFNTYRFADYKERVIDLLKRVCTVSVRTMEIVDGMAGYHSEK